VFSDQNDFSESPALARNVPSVFIWDVLAQNLEIVTIEKRVFRYRLGHGFCLCFGWLSLYRLFYVGLPSCTTQGRKDTRRNDGRVSLFYSVELVYFNLAVRGCTTAKILLLRHCITAKIPSNSQHSRRKVSLFFHCTTVIQRHCTGHSATQTPIGYKHTLARLSPVQASPKPSQLAGWNLKPRTRILHCLTAQEYQRRMLLGAVAVVCVVDGPQDYGRQERPVLSLGVVHK
jgi:hypothetical protein